MSCNSCQTLQGTHISAHHLESQLLKSNIMTFKQKQAQIIHSSSFHVTSLQDQWNQGR
ncbi:hypothetical protein HYC85_006742 [Camellia sinensis]|uniref:Uncharacterized protein n=1 Tax=Camellia sinensis TaxID=4442 RepID=A0A7J7HPG3_CAMSI|nr:hypothetical protein HYC85_006742 [Camellia sinensis]